jgi:hypothetical protein
MSLQSNRGTKSGQIRHLRVGNVNQKAKGKGQKAKGRHFIFYKSGAAFRIPLLPFALCLLPFDFLAKNPQSP